jgi:hypothetical protein
MQRFKSVGSAQRFLCESFDILGSGGVGCMTSVGHLDPADLDELT